jgi:indolepyruvate ferredoxin oxidoreductase alpha subunit
MREKVADRLVQMREEAEGSAANRIEERETSLGIITASIAYQYVREVWPEPQF